MKNIIYRIKETLIHEIIHTLSRDTSNDVWLIIIGINQRMEKAKQKACHISLPEIWFS